LPNPVAAIGDHRTQPTAEALLANPFFHLFDAAEFDACSALRFVSGDACAEVFIGEQFEVGMKLLVQVGIDAPNGEQVSQEPSGLHKEQHTEHLATLFPELA
ncbi:MAG TPA: hypothetical protein VK525_22680, partial [Candidatus Saccharimonadales bacterium]|nr:hypothetical protein [Candidatus Saccharimonadales bacterium]